MGRPPRKQRARFVAWILTGIRRSCGAGTRLGRVIVAVFFLTLFAPPAEAQNAGIDLTELPIEILLEIEFAPVAGGAQSLLPFSGVYVITEEAVFDWGTTSGPEGSLIIKVRVRNVMLQNGWCFYLPLFWDVNGPTVNAGIAEGSPEVSEGSAQ